MSSSASIGKAGRLLLTLQYFIQTCLYTNGQYYNEVIHLPAGPLSKEVSASANDMAFWLKQATGKSFEIKVTGAEGSKGISLEFVDRSGQNLPADIRKKISADGQSFYCLRVDSKHPRHA